MNRRSIFARPARACRRVLLGWGLAGLLNLVAFANLATGDEALLVHEWGTFTTLQDESGTELSGINVDDEPVPRFVHNLSPFLLGRPVLSHEHWAYRMKAAPRRHPQVTLRLETPVIYFYPPSGSGEMRVDVDVKFNGGWLTEFYPQAKADAPGLHDRNFEFGTLTQGTVGSLRWSGLTVGTHGRGPETDWRVWTAPREVAAANVRAAEGESERYLFYRGVGHRSAPLRVELDRASKGLTVRGNFSEMLSANQVVRIPQMWLVDIRDDRRCAFRGLGAAEGTADPAVILASSSYQFNEQDYSTTNLSALKTAMHSELARDGLFADEATAMLNTWERAYFVSPGLRLFYLVPRVWTDAVLPLTVSTDASRREAPVVIRVMIGRIELISDRQRAMLERLAEAPASSDAWIGKISDGEAREKFLAGHSDFGDLGVDIPDDYQLYLSLGRFRNALVVHEERARPQANLTQFINNYALHPFRIQAN